MSTLITGGAGLIGSHLAGYLAAKGEQVLVLDDFSSENKNISKSLSNRELVKIVKGSILDQGLVEQTMQSVTKCYHLAAALGVERINTDPIKSLEVNINGTEKENNLLDETHAIHGGGLPLITKGEGFVGVLLISGLPQVEDHLQVLKY
jgi:UDP-glucose 4-epimerase